MPDEPLDVEPFGCGVAPCGTSPAGLGTVGIPGARPTGNAGSRYLDPRTGDYVIDTDTKQQGQMPPTRQRVLLALLTARGSSTAAPEFGFRPPSKIGTAFEAEVRGRVRGALRHLTREDAPVIRIDQILVERLGPQRVRLTVSYTDLATREPDAVTV